MTEATVWKSSEWRLRRLQIKEMAGQGMITHTTTSRSVYQTARGGSSRTGPELLIVITLNARSISCVSLPAVPRVSSRFKRLRRALNELLE